jgi:hypothetical protein
MLETIAISIYAVGAAGACIAVARWAARREGVREDRSTRPGATDQLGATSHADLTGAAPSDAVDVNDLAMTEAEVLAERIDEHAAQISDLRATMLRLSLDLQEMISAARQEDARLRRAVTWERRARAAQAARRTSEIIDLSEHIRRAEFDERDLEQIRRDRSAN